jgi:hypothetical protein
LEDDMVHLYCPPFRSVSSGCANRSYKATESLDHAWSATVYNRGSVLSKPASCCGPSIPFPPPQGMLRGVACRIPRSRPSVFEAPGFRLQRHRTKIYAAFGGRGPAECPIGGVDLAALSTCLGTFTRKPVRSGSQAKRH